MATTIRSEYTWEHDGHSYNLRLRNSDLMNLEASRDETAGQTIRRVIEQDLGLRDTAQFLQRALMTGERMNRKEAQEMLDDVPYRSQMDAAIGVLMVAYGVPDGPPDADDTGVSAPGKKSTPKAADS